MAPLVAAAGAYCGADDGGYSPGRFPIGIVEHAFSASRVPASR
jgi:hypothetical protein